MFWIYIPPIIFIAGLVALVFILGKKSAALKRRKDLMPEKKFEAKRDWAGKLKNLWPHVLRFLESLMHYARVGIKKTETGLSGAIKKIREKRSGKKESAMPLGEQRLRDIEMQDDNISLEEREVQNIPAKKADIIREIDFIHEEIVVRKRPDPIPRRAEIKAMPEDKVQEDALIHRIAENPRDMEAYRELGDYYLATGNIKDAKESFKMVLKLRPRDLKAKSSLREIELKMRLGS